MTENQIKWAASHDWYVDHSDDNDVILVVDRWTEDGVLHQELRWFEDFTQLQEWAGY